MVEAPSLYVAHRLRVRALGSRAAWRVNGRRGDGAAAYIAKLAAGGVLLALFETSVAKMRIFRISEFLGAALMLGLLGVLLLFVTRTLQ